MEGEINELLNRVANLEKFSTDSFFNLKERIQKLEVEIAGLKAGRKFDKKLFNEHVESEKELKSLVKEIKKEKARMCK